MVNIKIDGKSISVEHGTSIVEAAYKLGIKIPTLCYLKEFGPTSSCRICLVEVVGNKNLVTACSFPIFEGMEVVTHSERIVDARKNNLELILSNHDYNCESCVRNNKCELQTLAHEYTCDENKYAGDKTPSIFDDSSFSIERDNSKCILCKRCVLACNKRQAVNAIGTAKRGFKTYITSPFDEPLAQSACVNCGQCIIACPTGALREIRCMDKVKKFLSDKTKHVIVAPAPSVRAGIGEVFGLPVGTDTEKILISALRKLGFAKVFDINFGADLTVVEEGNEFLRRLKSNTKLPMFTSCCPSWVDFALKFYPEFKDNLSTCKSPQQMFGAIAKTYYAEKSGIPAKDIVVVTIMPCTSKKTELTLPGMDSSSFRDIDVSITVRELAVLIKEKNIDFAALKGGEFDSLLGQSSGAGVIFGNSGGVMEASLRTVADLITGRDLEKIEYESVRGLNGLKEAKLNIGGNKLSIAVVSGLGNTKKLLDDISKGKTYYDFIEVMACPGGCINGGGMPLVTSDEQNFEDIRQKRIKTLYANDSSKAVRKAHKNPEIIKLYEWLGSANSKKAKDLLHLH